VVGLTVRKDDASLGFFLRQLEDIESEVQREEFSEQTFSEGNIVPLDIYNKPGVQLTTYRKITAVGAFKLHKNYSTEVPMVNLLSEEFSQRIHKWIGGYYISDDDIEAARLMLEISIEQEDVASVREAAMQQLNTLIAYGDPDLNMSGFLNLPDALHTYAPTPISSLSTPNQILALLNDSATASVTLTRQVEQPDTLILPVKQWSYATSARIDNTLEKTLMKQFLENTPYIKNVEVVNECEGAGIDGTDVMIMYKRDKKKVKAMVYEDFQFKPMERKGFGYQRPAYFRYAGLRVYRPYSIHIISGI
jgi:hypothetical protein